MMNTLTTDKKLYDAFYSECDRVFSLQQSNKYKIAKTTAKERIAKLKKLKTALLDTYNERIKEAVYSDLRKHEVEVELNEVLPVVGAINFAVKRIRSWMRDKPVPAPLNLFGFSHKLVYEPKGVVLIIAPWNFPVNLSLMPVVSAIASGNCIILKPSEHTPATSRLLKEMLSDLFAEEEITVLEGGIDESTYLLKKPFNHIFFTGAPAVGKIVMRAASEHLASISLELGGKSPTIIDESADLDLAARRIAWAKNLNNGQVCIAPDYILIHQSQKEAFIEKYKKYVSKAYGEDRQKSDSYGRIVNQKHFRRLISYLDDAKDRGGKILLGGIHDIEDNYIAPTIVTGLSDDSLLWQEEVFGPILPLRTYNNLSEVISHINKEEKPLALYIYSKKNNNIDQIIKETSSGAVVVNYSATHYTNPHLPFGGVNNSGIGEANGFYGFKAFSNAKGVQRHWSRRLDILSLVYPPYTTKKSKLSKLITRYFA